MDFQDIAQLERQLQWEHEERARQGWPASWADLPVFRSVYKQWEEGDITAWLESGNLACTEYMLETSSRYGAYLRVAEGNLREEGWRQFLSDTAGSRRKLRTALLSRYVELHKAATTQ
jgi:hypothetical protein